jgi:CMP-N,N'-diacetyllegionaminic acid synthase
MTIRGIPLLAHSLLQARETALFDHIAVSSDSNEILDVAKRWGADVLVSRPQSLATDTAPKIPVIRHCVSEAECRTGITFETCVDLDATSPLRSATDVAKCVALLEETEGVSNVVTGTPARRSPYFNLLEITPDGRVGPSKHLEREVTRRQDAPPCYDMNASIYAWHRWALMEREGLFHEGTRLYLMPPERSIDIDSLLDFELVDYLMSKLPEEQ